MLVFNRHIYRQFPLFFIFTLYTATVTIARLATITHYRFYFYVYWSTDAILVLLSLAALHEIFHWMFEGFYRLRWFRLFYYGTIAIALGIAVRNAVVAPPVQAHPVISLILDVGIAMNFVLAGIASLFFAFRWLLVIEFRRHAYGMVLGFGISSVLPLLGYLARSEFGTKLETFARYSSGVGYILGLAIWVASFSSPEPEDKWAPPMSPERMLAEVQGYLKVLGISERKR